MEKIDGAKSDRNKELSKKDNAKKSLSLEKYKETIDLLKWIIGTAGVTIITLIINWGFKDREQGMSEILQYDKYATELIIFNDNPINKRMIAQFFSHVTPSGKLKKGWQDYYKEVDAEYRSFLVKDSIEKARLNELMKRDTLELTNAEIIEKNDLSKNVAENDMIRRSPIHIPNNSTSKSNLIIYIKSVNAITEAEKTQALLVSLGFRAPAIEEVDPSTITLRENEIRYFFESERLTVLEIQEIIAAQNITTTIQYTPNNAHRSRRGAIELWITKGDS